MTVGEKMTRSPVTVLPDQPVGAVRALLRTRGVRQLPVVEGGRLVGILTDRDVRSADAAQPVRSAMTPDVITVTPDVAIDEAARLLVSKKIGALPVLQRGELVGILSTSDILTAFVELSGVLEPSYHITVGATPAEGERLRTVLARAHAEVKWMISREGLTDLRVRVHGGGMPQEILEEAGFRVYLCVYSRGEV